MLMLIFIPRIGMAWHVTWIGYIKETPLRACMHDWRFETLEDD
jgi:hypothetical protein